ncbi:MAG: OsmC family protein [Bacillota bacterium]|nr:OsmC family protein [Bacillota bacterium]MDW7684862.1 OsmC family protein [Bacillota bacterium]
MKTTVKWLGEQSYLGTDENGIAIKINPKPQVTDMVKPPDMLLMSLGSCTGLFFTPAVKELGLDIQTFEVVLTGEKAANPPELFKAINIHLKVWGSVTESQMEQAIAKSHQKCFILHSLHPDIEINTTFEILG